MVKGTDSVHTQLVGRKENVMNRVTASLSVMSCTLLLMTACGPSARWDDVDWDLEETRAGTYVGDLGVEAEARAAFVPVRRVDCTDTAALTLSETQIAQGNLSCDFGDDIGVLSIEMTGAVLELPLIDGTVSAEVDGEDLEMDWNGGFTAENAFFGELEGRTEVEGFNVVFSGWFEVERVYSGSSTL